MTGVLLGKSGYWLPRSVDCSLYALAVYYLGYCFRKYDIAEYFFTRKYTYFILSCIWAYSIYQGGMGIATRNYGAYGLSILGAISASILLYMLSQYMCQTWNARIISVLCLVGRNTIYILMIHKLTENLLWELISPVFHPNGAAFAASVAVLQVLWGAGIGFLLEWAKKKAKARKRLA